MATKRITPAVKKIAEAHISAKISGNFDDPIVSSTAELIKALNDGKTSRLLLEQIEIRFCSVGALLMASGNIFNQYLSSNYKAGIYKGFKTILL